MGKESKEPKKAIGRLVLASFNKETREVDQDLVNLARKAGVPVALHGDFWIVSPADPAAHLTMAFDAGEFQQDDVVVGGAPSIKPTLSALEVENLLLRQLVAKLERELSRESTGPAVPMVPGATLEETMLLQVPPPPQAVREEFAIMQQFNQQVPPPPQDVFIGQRPPKPKLWDGAVLLPSKYGVGDTVVVGSKVGRVSKVYLRGEPSEGEQQYDVDFADGLHRVPSRDISLRLMTCEEEQKLRNEYYSAPQVASEMIPHVGPLFLTAQDQKFKPGDAATIWARYATHAPKDVKAAVSAAEGANVVDIIEVLESGLLVCEISPSTDDGPLPSVMFTCFPQALSPA